jgi:hypothetical protein
LRAVKSDLPKLLGFSEASIFMHDSNHGNLYAISIDEVAEKRARENYGTFETEFAFDDS